MNLFDFLKPRVTVVTHNGAFHADDVFAVATLQIWAEKTGKKLKIVRSRDTEVIEKGDIVLDVGGVYDPEKNRFDHHQRGGAGTHNNGIPYAAFGLIWKHYGEKITSKEVAEIIEKKLVMQDDARDNGSYISKPETNNYGLPEYRLGTMVAAFRPINGTEKRFYNRFARVVEFAKEIIEGEIEFAEAEMAAEKEVARCIQEQNSPEILVLDKIVKWEKALVKEEGVKFVISPDYNNTNWKIEAPRSDLEDYDSNRAWFPENWRGLSGNELEIASEIKEAIFCHRKGFFAVAKTKEAAVALAQKALENRG